MKHFLIAFLVLSSFGSLGSFGSSFGEPSGSASFVASPITTPGLGQYQVSEDGGKLIGSGGSNIYLERQNGGYKGFAFGRPFDLSCSSTTCTDNGSTEVSLRITRFSDGNDNTAEGYAIDGMLNYMNVHAVNAGSKISVSVQGDNTSVSLDLARHEDGNYSGFGSSGARNPFTVTLDDEGSLAGFTDPATFVVLIISPLVGN